jgi:putative phosphoesterase
MPAKSVRIGLISDTHGLLRPEAIVALRGSQLILHAGDIGSPEVLDGLNEIAPTLAVRGNNDTQPWARRVPDRRVIDAGGATLYLLHQLAELDIDPSAAGHRAVIFGHSHKPLVETRGHVVFVNPGSAGPRRFRLPVGVARMNVRRDKVEVELVSLNV